ncbi:hypothetical protein CDCA_CDCA15G3979 [Cyanidium caldarium]|uniref:Uncharacterized protein n=1 Tax=Cyanidium caldarium TaxID=2771 RepID=A0AAV9J074_CYACA|nr:hypothetical protein CDCA_CDCA15G3979 [Cyanidium caldarium]
MARTSTPQSPPRAPPATRRIRVPALFSPRSPLPLILSSALVVGRPTVLTAPYYAALLTGWAVSVDGHASRGRTAAGRKGGRGLYWLFFLYAVGVLIAQAVVGAVYLRGGLGALTKDAQRTLASLGLVPAAPLSVLAVHGGVAYWLVRRRLSCDARAGAAMELDPALFPFFFFAALAEVLATTRFSLYRVVMLVARSASFAMAPWPTTPPPSMSTARTALLRLIILVAYLLTFAYAMALFVFQWEWIRQARAAEAPAARLLGVHTAGWIDYATMVAAVLANTGGWSLLRGRASITLPSVGKALTQHEAGLGAVALATSLIYATGVPGVLSATQAGLVWLATCCLPYQRLSQALRVVVALTAVVYALAATILGTVLEVNGRHVVPVLGLPNALRTAALPQWQWWAYQACGMAATTSALAYVRAGLAPQTDENTEPSRTVRRPSFLYWAWTVACLALLARVYLVAITWAVLALLMRLRPERKLSASPFLITAVVALSRWMQQCQVCRYAAYGSATASDTVTCLLNALLVVLCTTGWSANITA